MTIFLPASTSGRESWALLDVLGVEHAFNDDASFLVTAGSRGRPMPGVTLVTDPVPFRAGAWLRRANVDQRVLTVPVWIAGSTYLETRDRLAQLAGWLDPSRGDVAWRVTRPDGLRRELVCRYRGGLEDISGPTGGGMYCTADIDVLAADPYWQDLDDTVLTWTVPAASSGFFPFSLPLRLPSSTVWVSETIDNSGYDQQDAWPVWTIVGPGIDPVLRNLTTGKAIRISRTLAAGDQLIIDTRPGVKSVTDGLGTVIPPVAGSALWALVRGLNTIQVEFSGATSDVSSVSLAYRVRYLGP